MNGTIGVLFFAALRGASNVNASRGSVVQIELAIDFDVQGGKVNKRNIRHR